jgi:hypothetical protein
VGRFECGDSLLSRHGGKGVEELIETVPPLEVVDEVSKRRQ